MIPLLTDNEITENTNIGGNVDVDKLRIALQDAQEIDLQEILGEDLYEKICDDFDGDDLDGDYGVLHDKYLRPYLWHRAAMHYLKTGAFQINNGGIYKHTPANGQPVEKTEADYLSNDQRIKSEVWQQRMEKYLALKNFSEYTANTDTIVPPNRETNVSPWYFGQSPTYSRNDEGDL